jgi:hypothetical protein
MRKCRKNYLGRYERCRIREKRKRVGNAAFLLVHFCNVPLSALTPSTLATIAKGGKPVLLDYPR